MHVVRASSVTATSGQTEANKSLFDTGEPACETRIFSTPAAFGVRRTSCAAEPELARVELKAVFAEADALRH